MNIISTGNTISEQWGSDVIHFTGKTYSSQLQSVDSANHSYIPSLTHSHITPSLTRTHHKLTYTHASLHTKKHCTMQFRQLITLFPNDYTDSIKIIDSWLNMCTHSHHHSLTPTHTHTNTHSHHHSLTPTHTHTITHSHHHTSLTRTITHSHHHLLALSPSHTHTNTANKPITRSCMSPSSLCFLILHWSSLIR